MKYEVELYAQVWHTVTVEASSEEEARERVFEEIDDGYEVDFSIQSVSPATEED